MRIDVGPIEAGSIDANPNWSEQRFGRLIHRGLRVSLESQWSDLLWNFINMDEGALVWEELTARAWTLHQAGVTPSQALVAAALATASANSSMKVLRVILEVMTAMDGAAIDRYVADQF